MSSKMWCVKLLWEAYFGGLFFLSGMHHPPYITYVLDGPSKIYVTNVGWA